MSVAPLPAHDAILAGDTLTTISLNMDWRAIIAGALNQYWATNQDDTTTLDNLDLLMSFFNDLYD
jgi:hypothetical protein